VVRVAALMLVAYVAIPAYGLNEFRKTPTGFIPQVDRGYLIMVVQLPPGASLARTDAVHQRAIDMRSTRRASSMASTSSAFPGRPLPTRPMPARSSSRVTICVAEARLVRGR
jgi:multidrug efflux pump subunit AcrB